MALPQVTPDELALIKVAVGNGHDGAHVYLENGGFLAVSHYETMLEFMKGAKSAQGRNDREFYEKHVPNSTEIMVRITKRKVEHLENNKRALSSEETWKQADGLLYFEDNFQKVVLTSEGEELLSNG